MIPTWLTDNGGIAILMLLKATRSLSMYNIKKESVFSLKQSLQLSQKHEVILKSSDYSEPLERINPALKSGYALENDEQKEICSFYNYCLTIPDFDSQVMCLKSNKIICRHRLFVRNLAD